MKVVHLFNGDTVECKVEKRDDRLDIIWLMPVKNFEHFPTQYRLPTGGELYIHFGFSNYKLWPNSTLSETVGNITSDRVDARKHNFGSVGPCDGDAGGPVFSFYTGELLGVGLGCHYNEHMIGKSDPKAAIVAVNLLIR